MSSSFGAGVLLVSGGLVADDATVIGVADDVLIPVVLVVGAIVYIGLSIYEKSTEKKESSEAEAEADKSDKSKGKAETEGDSKAEIPDLDKVDDKYLKKKGVDAHHLKKDIYGKKAKVAEYDIYVDKKTGELYTQRKPQYNIKGEPPIATGEHIK